MSRVRRWVCSMGMGALIALAGQAAAQDATPPASPSPTDATAPPAPLVTTLEEVRALPPDQEQLDLYTFDNPIKVEPNRFGSRYRPPPSPQDISEGGVYLVYGFAKLVGAAAQGLQKIPGIKHQVQPAIARPPPLDLEQMDRAARISADNTAADPAAQQAALPGE